MNAIVQLKKDLPALQMDRAELTTVLKNSLYPGAQDDSIALVLGYCQAAGLDPMQKPVHIVPMWSSQAKAMRDVIMPGIGLYRTQAARTGFYAGISEPEFGPDETKSIGGANITYPAWCRVMVKRLMPNGQIAEFSAVERWMENYAVKGGQEKSIAPNAMWQKRPYGQLAKCAEAQALRKAFPEVGSQATADEMEGKYYGAEEFIEASTGDVVNRKPDPVVRQPEPPKPYPNERFISKAPSWLDMIDAGKTADEIIHHLAKWELNEWQLSVLRGEKSLDEFVEAFQNGEIGE